MSNEELKQNAYEGRMRRRAKRIARRAEKGEGEMGEETVEKMGDGTQEKRAGGGSSTVQPDHGSTTSQPTTDSDVSCNAFATTEDRNEKGQFKEGWKGGPGRPPKSRERRADRDGGGAEAPVEVNLLAAFNAMLSEFGPEKFALSLIRKSPVVAAQMMAALTKIKGKDGTAVGTINVTGIPGLPGPEGAELASLRHEVEALRAERGKADPDEPTAPAAMDAVDAVTEPDEPSEPSEPDYLPDMPGLDDADYVPEGGACCSLVAGGPDRGGWVSHGSIGEALASHR